MHSCDATCISAKIFNHEKEKTYDFKSIFREKYAEITPHGSFSTFNLSILLVLEYRILQICSNID